MLIEKLLYLKKKVRIRVVFVYGGARKCVRGVMMMVVGGWMPDEEEEEEEGAE